MLISAAAVIVGEMALLTCLALIKNGPQRCNGKGVQAMLIEAAAMIVGEMALLTCLALIVFEMMK
jgi:hypothetical protein